MPSLNLKYSELGLTITMEDKKYQEDRELVDKVKQGDEKALSELYNRLDGLIMEKAFFICRKTCSLFSGHAKYCQNKKTLSSCEDYNTARTHVFSFLLNLEKKTGPILNYRAISSLRTYAYTVLEKYTPYLVMNWYRKITKRYPYSSHYPSAVKKLSSLHQEVFALMTVGKGREYIASHLSLSLNLPLEEALVKAAETMNDIEHELIKAGQREKIAKSETQIDETRIKSHAEGPEEIYLNKLIREKLLEKFNIIKEASRGLGNLEKLILRFMAEKDWSGKEIARNINKSSIKSELLAPGKKKITEQEVYTIIEKALKKIYQNIQENHPDFFEESDSKSEWPGMEETGDRIKCLKKFLKFYGLKPIRNTK